jgi:nicotinamidase-related amidase
MKKFKLFGIDLQNEFTKAGFPLCVPGAPEDTQRIVNIIRSYSECIDDIVLTADTHPIDHIGHAGWWKLKGGSEPNAFTLVTSDAVHNGEILPANEYQLQYGMSYISILKQAMIWNTHCVPGTESHRINASVMAAVLEWGGTPSIIKKGFDRDSEAFGAFQSEFLNGHPGTDFNWNLYADLIRDKLPIVVVGEARSHCVRRTIEQFVDRVKRNDDYPLKRLIILEDCMSDVPGFEADGEKFIQDMKDCGAVVCKSADLNAVLETV